MSSLPKQERRKRQWGDANSSDSSSTLASTMNTSSSTNAPSSTQLDAKAKALALQASIAARLAALKAAKATSSSSTSSVQQQQAQRSDDSHINQQRPMKKAKVYDLDLSITTPQYKKDQEVKPTIIKKKINPYLAHLEQDDDNNNNQSNQNDDTMNHQNKKDGSNNLKIKQEDDEIILDNRLTGGKNKIAKQRVANKKINFIEPGTYIEKAKKKHLSNLNAIQSGYRSGRKQGMHIEATAIATVNDQEKDATDYYGTNDNQEERNLAPRMDTIYTGYDSANSGTKHTNGVVPIPLPLVMEWWDLVLLPKQLRKEIVAKEGELVMNQTKQQLIDPFQQKKESNKSNNNDSSDLGNENDNNNEIQTLTQKCYIAASITNSKTYQLVQHPKPIIPPSLQNQEDKPKPVLHLTKKELKRQRKLRRAEKQREIQDLQSVGILPKPEPKLTLSNYMRVLGTQAVLDPSAMESKVQEQIQARKLKHERMNLERKEKAKELRTLKREQEAQSSTSNDNVGSVSIALFLVKDMSHRYHRTKVDLNAQQWKITGGVIECEADPKLALVIAEGDEKAIKKYTRLMTVRMKWKGENFVDDDDGAEEDSDIEMQDDNDAPKQQKFNADNSCELVWTGMSAKRMFRSFLFQSCPTSVHARKVLEAKGVAHFWDQVLVHANRSGETFNFKLG